LGGRTSLRGEPPQSPVKIWGRGTGGEVRWRKQNVRNKSVGGKEQTWRGRGIAPVVTHRGTPTTFHGQTRGGVGGEQIREGTVREEVFGVAEQSKRKDVLDWKKPGGTTSGGASVQPSTRRGSLKKGGGIKSSKKNPLRESGPSGE